MHTGTDTWSDMVPGDWGIGLPGVHGLLHDLGHDLATLALLVEGVRADDKLTPDTRHRVNLIERQTSRLLGLVREGVRYVVTPPEIAVRTLLAELVEVADARGSTSVTLRPGPPILLAADANLLWRMVTNLVGNAIRAAGPGGRVEVSVTRQDERTVEVRVADDGPGFGHAPDGTASVGLRVVHQLAAISGARVEHESPPGGGAVVRLVFEAPVDTREFRDGRADDGTGAS